MSQQQIKKDDCIQLIFRNPYLGIAPETYDSFDMSTPYSEPCVVSFLNGLYNDLLNHIVLN